MTVLQQIGDTNSVIEQANSINVLHENVQIFNQNCFDFLIIRKIQIQETQLLLIA